MAHYKRKRAKTSSSGQSNDRWNNKQRRWMCHWPRWWDIVFHTRPTRRRAGMVTRNVLLGKVDAEDASWPMSKKPHVYYW